MSYEVIANHSIFAMTTNVIIMGTMNAIPILRAIALIWLNFSVYFSIRTCFFYFALTFLKNTHTNLFILQFILFK